jgi:hypothetical protein
MSPEVGLTRVCGELILKQPRVIEIARGSMIASDIGSN